MLKTDDKKTYTRNNLDEHYLVIIDNMVCLPSSLAEASSFSPM